MQKITTRQLCVIIIISFTLSKLGVLPATLSGLIGEGIWLSATINLLLDFLLLLLAIKIICNSKVNFPTLLTQTFGKTPSKIISLLYCLFFILKAFVPILEQKNTIELTFYETQPTLFTFMPFFIVAFYIVIKGINPFGRSMEFCIWIFIFGIAVTLLLSFPAGNYSNLLPIFGKPITNVLSASFKTLLWFGDSVYLFYFIGHLKTNSKTGKNLIKSYIIYSLLTLSILVVFYAIFESIAGRQYYAILKMSKYSITLSNIGRYDYIAALLLSAISVYQTTLPLLFATNALNDVYDFKNKLISPSIVFALTISLTLLFQNSFFTSINFVQNYVIYFFILMTYILPLIIFITLQFRRKKWYLKEQKY